MSVYIYIYIYSFKKNWVAQTFPNEAVVWIVLKIIQHIENQQPSRLVLWKITTNILNHLVVLDVGISLMVKKLFKLSLKLLGQDVAARQVPEISGINALNGWRLKCWLKAIPCMGYMILAHPRNSILVPIHNKTPLDQGSIWTAKSK